ncbi:MAG: hypothetical protein LBC23_00605 [Coriobacteriales bacterium]|jgi:hypothetical protein|nr:hypothetical protein [Coriobacteriales bacterium]
MVEAKMLKKIAAMGSAGLLVMAVLMGMSGCDSLTIGDKAKVESYLEEKYGGEFEVIIPDGAPEALQDGTVLSFPVYAHSLTDPQVTFKVSEKSGGGYEDMYRVALVERQAKEIVDTALLEVDLKAVSGVLLFFETDAELAEIQENVDVDLREYLSRDTTPVLTMMVDIAIAEPQPTPSELEAKLTQAFALIDERMLGKENIGYGFVLVETDDFDAFCDEVERYGVGTHPEFETATVINYLFPQDGGSFNHQGYRRPLSESLSVLLGEAPPWYENDE